MGGCLINFGCPCAVLSMATPYMEHLLKSPHSLWLFFLITAAIGWASSQYELKLLKEFSPVSLALLDAMLTIVALLTYGAITDGWAGVERPLREIVHLVTGESALLGVLALYGAGAGLLGAALLKHHGVVDYRLTRMLISIAVGAVGVWAIADQGMTWTRGAGLALLAGGAALTLYE